MNTIRIRHTMKHHLLYTLLLCFGMALLAHQSRAQGQIAYEYDSAGRLVRVTYADSTSMEYSYDKNGNILSIRGTGKQEPNRAPTSASAAITTDEDTESAPVTPDVTDPDDGDTHTIAIVDQPQSGAATVTANQLVYTPDADFNGQDSFTFSATDRGGLSVTGTANVTVNPVNDPPVAVDDNVTTTVDTKTTFDVRVNDTDVDGDHLTLQTITQPANGSAQIILDDHIEYMPGAGFTGTDSFDYTIEDGNGGADTGTVTVTVNDADSPVAADDNASTDEDTPITVDVLANDTDPAGMGLTVTSTTPPANGAVQDMGGGMLEYTPDEDFSGTDSFGYTIEDGNGASASATVTVTVTPVNDPPDAFMRTAPVDGTTQAAPVTFTWTEAGDAEDDAVTYLLYVSAGNEARQYTTENTAIAVDFAAHTLTDGQYEVDWSLRATDGTDTTDASNGAGSFTLDYVTGVDDLAAAGVFALGQNYPNPFGDNAGRKTIIPYTVRGAVHLVLTVYDARGREVARLADGRHIPGVYTAAFDSEGLPAGTYHYALESEGRRIVRKLVIVR